VTVAGNGEKASVRPRVDRRLLAWLAIVIGIVYLVVLGGSWFGIYLSPLRIVSVGMATIGLAGWAWVARGSPQWRPSSALMPVIAAALGSLTLSTVFSRSPRISLEYLGYSIVLAALYLLLVRLLADPFFRPRLVALASLLFVGISAIYLALVFVHWVQWWQLVGRLTVPPLRPDFEGLTYGNPSAVLTLVALLAVPTAANIPSSFRWRYPAWLLIGLDVAIVALLSGSRAGWLALALTTLVVPIVWLINPGHRAAAIQAVRRVARTWRAQGMIGLVGIAIIGAGVLLGPALAGRLGAGGEELRAQYTVVAIRLFVASPIVGTGPGTWVIQRPGQTFAGENDTYIPHAHNLEVQTLAELGVVGAVAGVFLVASLLRLLGNAAGDRDPVRRRWAWVAGIGLLYFVFHQLLDFYPGIPGILLAAVIPVAYLDATSTPRPVAAEARLWPIQRRMPRLPGPPGRILSVVVIAIALVGLLLQEIPALQEDQAAVAADRGDWAAADGPARAAAAEDPDVGTYDLTAGLTAAHAGEHLAAAGYFEAVVSRSDLPEAWLDLAAEQLQLGHASDAANSLKRALRIGIQRPAVSMPAGYLALQMGNDALAVNAFAAAIESVPSLAGDPWWRLAPQSRVAPKVFEKGITSGPVVDRWEIALMAGDPDRARKLAQESGDPTGSQEFIDAWTGGPPAAARIFAECDANPLDVTLLERCGRVSRRLGDPAQGDKYGVLAEAANGGSFSFSAELRVDQGLPIGRIEGMPASLWGTYTYRRTTPADILVPSLIHLTIE
jgi:O-antigen ligase/tetratricopeptide (TPR) repeat protein